MDERAVAYLTILQWGLLRIRALALAGKVRECEVEADHLHNIPSLIDEPNEQRHIYYLECERPAYLESAGYSMADDSTLCRYEEAWETLAQFRN